MADNDMGNVSDKETPQIDYSPDDFFSALDQSVNGGILESENDTLKQTTLLEEGENNPSNKTMSPGSEAQQETVESLKKRYADSSKEGKRLNQRLKELEPYVPILDEMRKDSNLIQHVQDYFEGGGQAPKSMKTELKLDEDFVFDADEALTDNSSDSARLFSATVDGIVNQKIGKMLNKERAESDRVSKEQQFKDKNKMDAKEWDGFIEYAKSHNLTLEDILYLRNRKTREDNIAKSVTDDISNQIKKSQSTPSSLASTGSTSIDVSPDDDLFDAILGIDKQLDNAFG